MLTGLPLRLLLLLLLLLALAGCTASRVQDEPLAMPGVAIKTLQGGVNVSLSSPAGQMSGNGVLFYQSPDSFRLTILAPFGQSLFDLIINGDRVLYLLESRKQAWQGGVHDLPEGLGLRIWPLLKWVVEPPHPAGASLERSFNRSDGTVERVYYAANGLVQKKINAGGDEAIYRDYRRLDGIAVPADIEIRTFGSTLRLIFDEPEVNRPIDSDILNPLLEQYELHPLSEFRGY